MSNQAQEIQIMKTFWKNGPDGVWRIHDLKALTLRPRVGFEADFFQIDSEMELLTQRPLMNNSYGWMTSFGPTDYLLKQSVVPVVAWADGESSIRCIGTAFIISCTGYLITPCHVLLDPIEGKYAQVERTDNRIKFLGGIRFGVLIPISPATGQTGSLFFPFQDSRYWGQWKKSPLLHEEDRFEILTDIAICRIAMLPDGSGHQPLAISLNSPKKGERVIALGYAEMDDIPIVNRDGMPTVPESNPELHVSVGPVKDLFPDNHIKKHVPTPGPCFDFLAKVPGKMSGGPILGEASLLRGVVSRSFMGEKHAFGAMTGPAMDLQVGDNTTLRTLMKSGNEGIPLVSGSGL